MQVRSELLPILRTPFLGELLAWIYLHPEEAYSLTELATRLGMSHATVSREADRLVVSGLLCEERRGNLRLVRANPKNPLVKPLTELLMLTYGPISILGELLAMVNHVNEAYIYGSWAARYAGQPGEPPRDVDVLVVGDADDDDLFEVARDAERHLGREVNIHKVSAKLWNSPDDDPFLSSVRSRPLVAIDLQKGQS